MKTNLKILLGIFIALLLTGCYYIFAKANINSAKVDSTSSKYEKVDEVLVYETEVDSADQCSSYEVFDAAKSVCSFECASEIECTEIQKSIDDELASWTDELKKDDAPVAEIIIKDNDKSERATYKVSPGEKISFVSGNDAQEYRKIWDDIKVLSPDNISDKYIEEYQVFDNEKDDTLAFVDDQDGNGKWRIAINLAGHKSSNEREQKATFIHELAHIITLNLSQLDPAITKEKCKNFYLDEGCTYANSYLNIFKNTFWKNVTTQNFSESKFVTDYATTNEVEDAAESFAFFVLGKGQDILGDSVRDQKIKSFYNYPELVAIRKDMRNNLSAEIVRAKKISQTSNN